MSKASVYFTLGDLENKHDSEAIKRELDTLPGVRSVSISDSSNRVAVDFDTMASLNQKIIEMISVPMPDRKVQDKIVAILSLIDEKAKNNREINDNLAA